MPRAENATQCAVDAEDALVLEHWIPRIQVTQRLDDLGHAYYELHVERPEPNTETGPCDSRPKLVGLQISHQAPTIGT
jgi:hypothetical protein